MTVIEHLPVRSDLGRLRVVLCGTFRRDREGLEAAFAALEQDYTLLSPRSLDFVNPDDEFVRLASERDESVLSVEERHLEAVRQSDFVWLHAPDGYVGRSAALEIGHAHALGIPVYSQTAPEDQTLRAFVTVVQAPAQVRQHLVPNPGSGIAALQKYYARTAERRGWDSESAQQTLLLMTEELGELARAVRKHVGIARDHASTGAVGEEMADMALYLVHLANALGIDLAAEVSAKERVNEQRFRARSIA